MDFRSEADLSAFDDDPQSPQAGALLFGLEKGHCGTPSVLTHAVL